MSISKQQAQQLADGFLDNLGDSNDDFQPRESLSTLLSLAGGLVEKAQANLNNRNSNASGNLSESLRLNEPVEEGKSIRIDISMLEYGQFINKGVRGTKSGAGDFAFKYDTPSLKMVNAIKEWIRQGKIKTTNVNKKKTIYANEKKNATLSDLSNAYAVARSITQYGIRKTGFLDKAVSQTRVIAKIELGRALKIDVIKSLPKKIGK